MELKLLPPVGDYRPDPRPAERPRLRLVSRRDVATGAVIPFPNRRGFWGQAGPCGGNAA
jgi:hypothetical protein